MKLHPFLLPFLSIFNSIAPHLSKGYERTEFRTIQYEGEEEDHVVAKLIWQWRGFFDSVEVSLMRGCYSTLWALFD